MFDECGAVIPAYNPGDALLPVLEGVRRYIRPDHIVVVDDGSVDGTARRAESAGVSLVRHGSNRGKGEALKSGFEYLLALSEIDAIFTIDADGQHDPEEIPAFIEAYRAGRGEVLVGNRMSERIGMPLIRVLTNIVTSAVVSALARRRIEDSQSGYRLISAEVIRKIDLVTSRYETESEILIKSSRIGAKIASVPIRTIYGSEESTINPFRDTVRFFVLVFRGLFW
jgi:glycosyltransferase involved in cell wall biosynthesis